VLKVLKKNSRAQTATRELSTGHTVVLVTFHKCICDGKGAGAVILPVSEQSQVTTDIMHVMAK